jgi:hypothetical protein
MQGRFAQDVGPLPPCQDCLASKVGEADQALPAASRRPISVSQLAAVPMVGQEQADRSPHPCRFGIFTLESRAMSQSCLYRAMTNSHD